MISIFPLIIPLILIDLLLIVFPILYFKAKKQNPLEKLGFNKISFKQFSKQSVLIFLNLFVYSIVIAIFLTLLNLNDLVLVEDAVKELLTLSPLFIAYLLIVRVSAEEIFFRGFLVNKIGVIPSSLLFGIAHIGYASIAQVIGAFLLGLILAIAFKQNKNLYSNIAAHAFYNLFILLMV